MSKLLYVTCNLKPEETSCSLSIARNFLDEYRKHNPGDDVCRLDLYRDNIQRIDSDVMNGWGKLENGTDFTALTMDEQRKIGRIGELTDQFIDADKYVFATPMWNLGFPAELKIYIDTVCVVGKTFVYTEAGPKGLLKDQGRKCMHIHSSGGFHFGKEEDHSVPYLKSIMAFMGINDFESIVIEGVDALPDRAEEIKNTAAQKARDMAAKF